MGKTKIMNQHPQNYKYAKLQVAPIWKRKCTFEGSGPRPNLGHSTTLPSCFDKNGVGQKKLEHPLLDYNVYSLHIVQAFYDMTLNKLQQKLLLLFISIRPGGSNGHFNIHVELFACLATSQNLLYLP